MSVASIEHLTKRYGKITAVEDFSISVDSGEIVALVGPDGAGKTSIMRSMCGLISFAKGTIRIAGKNISSAYDAIKPVLGYMPQTFSLYPDLSVQENLVFYGGLFGITGSRLKEKMQMLYRFSGLEPFKERRAGFLSGGMKQKLALSCALIHDPLLLVLDEPTTGVDPLSRRQFWEILRGLKESGTAIFVSTPYMDEVERADRAVFLHNGKRLAEGVPGELPGLFSGVVYRIEIEPTVERVSAASNIEGITARRFGASIHLYLGKGHRAEEYTQQLEKAGIDVSHLNRIEPDLEDTFIQLMETA
jgi:ABC-2 type transport system ATP-binding protein